MHITRYTNAKGQPRYRVIVQDGGRRSKAGLRTEREAKRWGALLSIELGKQPDPSEATLLDLIEMHLADKPRAVTTTEDYRYLLAKVPGWLMDWKVENVTPMMIDQAYKRLLTDTWKVDGEVYGPMSAHRLRRLHGIIRPAFDLAVKYGWTVANPAVSIHPPAAPASDVGAPTPDDVRALLEAADLRDPAFGAALRLVASTGCRRGELCGLQWADFDEKAGTVRIQRSVSTTTNAPHTITEGKTGRKGHRPIHVGPSVVAALKAHRARQRTDLLAKGVTRTIWMFTLDGAHPWRTDYVTLSFSRLRDELGMDMHLHQLRHYVATRLIAGGVDIKTVSGRLGHSKIATTADMYADVIPANDKNSADIMEREHG